MKENIKFTNEVSNVDTTNIKEMIDISYDMGYRIGRVESGLEIIEIVVIALSFAYFTFVVSDFINKRKNEKE